MNCFSYKTINRIPLQVMITWRLWLTNLLTFIFTNTLVLKAWNYLHQNYQTDVWHWTTDKMTCIWISFSIILTIWTEPFRPLMKSLWRWQAFWASSFFSRGAGSGCGTPVCQCKYALPRTLPLILIDTGFRMGLFMFAPCNVALEWQIGCYFSMFRTHCKTLLD